MRAIRDDAATVADRVIAFDEVRTLRTGRGRSVRDVRVAEGQPGRFQTGEDLQAITIVAGHAEQSGIGAWGEPRFLLHDRRDALHAAPSQRAHSRRRTLALTARIGATSMVDRP